MASSSSATVAVDKATSDLLITPDWTMNIDICDSINSNHWQAKDVVKAVKKRLQHKNPRVQFLALTLLETMVKNCGDFVHFQIAEKNLLGEMVKIVKKKTDIQVRDKVLVLLDSWQEAFGGPGGRYSQYYWAYEELRRSGVRFPPRALNAAPIFTPPLTHSTLRPAEPGYGMPGGSSRRLDETMATEIEGLSLSSLESMRDVMELLGDMLQAVNPGDREAVKEEVIVDLVEHCRSNQKKLVQMLTTTGHSKSQPSPTQGSSEASRALVPIETSQTSSDAASSFLPTSNALAVIDPVKNTQEQDIIDLLSITLSTDWTSQPNTSQETASTTEQSVPQIPVSSGTQAYPGSQGPAPFDSYVVPWAQPQPQPQPQHHSQPSQAPSPSQSQPQPMHYHQQQQQFRPQFEPQMQSQFQSQQQYQYPQYSSAYPPPPWAVTPGYANGSSQSYVPSNTFSMPHSNSTTSFPQRAAAATLMQQQQQQQNYGNSSNGTALNGDPIVGLGTRGPAQPAVQKPFVPSYRLFEDLNVLGSAEGKFKVNGSTAPSLSSSTSGQSMVGGRK
ncbi:TOM1-like protein 6 [Linum perenne]